jgi:hypothetical protein
MVNQLLTDSRTVQAMFVLIQRTARLTQLLAQGLTIH